MMMKLMKFLVVALVAGGVFTSTTVVAGPSGKAVLCDQSTGNKSQDRWTDERVYAGEPLVAFSFHREKGHPSLCSNNCAKLYERVYRWDKQFHDTTSRGTFFGGMIIALYKVRGSLLHPYDHSEIVFSYPNGGRRILNRRTLELKSPWYGTVQCELINYDKIISVFEAYEWRLQALNDEWIGKKISLEQRARALRESKTPRSNTKPFRGSGGRAPTGSYCAGQQNLAHRPTVPNYRKRDYQSAPTAHAQPPMTAAIAAVW